MFLKLRKYLLIFLALLQLVAPLVHAHAGRENIAFSDSGSGKLHIPGLEIYVLEHETLLFEPDGHHCSDGGVVIGVDAGIKQKQAKLINNFYNTYLLPQQPVTVKPLMPPLAIDFSPPAPVYVCRLLNALHIARAPPSH